MKKIEDREEYRSDVEQHSQLCGAHGRYEPLKPKTGGGGNNFTYVPTDEDGRPDDQRSKSFR